MEKIDSNQIRIVLDEISINRTSTLVKIVFTDGRQLNGNVINNGNSYTLKIHSSNQHRVFTLDHVEGLYIV